MIMKMKTFIQKLTTGTAAAARLSGNFKTHNTMKKLKAIILLLLLVPHAGLLHAQTTESFTFTTNRVVPDGNFSGLNDVRTITSSVGNISTLKVRLKLAGEFNGDVYAYLRHTNGFVILLNRVGKTASNPDGYGDSGFDVTFQTGAGNGDIHVYQNVTNPADGSPITGYWQPDGRTNDPAVVLDSSVRATSLTNFNGLNGAGEWTLFMADLQSGGTNMLTEWGLDISGAASPALTWTNPATITYGTALGGAQLNATATYSSTNVPGTFVYTPAAGTVLNAGSNQTISVTFTPTDTNSFLPVTTNVTINVVKAALTVTADSTNKVYGASLPVFTASYAGFVNGDTNTSLTTQPTIGTTATASSPVGNYAITASGAASGNYSISYAAGTLTITPATLTITADSTNKVYGASLPVFTASYAGFVNGDTAASLTTPITLGTTATASSPVGNYTITSSGAVYSNYNIGFVNGTLTITKSALSGTVVSSANPQLTGSNVTFTATVSAVAPGAGTATGTVNFRIDGSVIGVGTLSGGVATFTTNGLAHGSHTVVAEYAGDLNFTGTTNSLAVNQVINTPPVAGNDTIERNPALSVKVRLTVLLTNDSDADGDPVTPTVSTTSANGGTIRVSGGFVFYTPPAGFTNADSFTYTITDGHGGSAIGTVTVAVPVDNTQSQNLTITDLGGGSMLINGSGIPGYTYRLQYSDVTGPFIWQDLMGVTADGTGKFSYTDTSAAPMRFYRTVYP